MEKDNVGLEEMVLIKNSYMLSDALRSDSI